MIFVDLYKHEHIWAIYISSHLLMIYPNGVMSIPLGITLEHLINFLTIKTLQRSKQIISLRFYDLTVEESINLMSSIPFVNKKVFKENLHVLIHLNKMVY